MPGKMGKKDINIIENMYMLEEDIRAIKDGRVHYAERLEQLCAACYIDNDGCLDQCTVLTDKCIACGRPHSGGSTCSYCEAWGEAIEEYYNCLELYRPGNALGYENIMMLLVRAITIEAIGFAKQ